jgi:hypothetical protein
LTRIISSFIVSNNRCQTLQARWTAVPTTTMQLGGVRSGRMLDRIFRNHAARQAVHVGYQDW